MALDMIFRTALMPAMIPCAGGLLVAGGSVDLPGEVESSTFDLERWAELGG